MKRIILTTAILSLGLCCACTTLPPPDSSQIPEEVRKSDKKEIALGNKLMKSILADNYKLFAECVKDGPAAQITEKDFKTSRSNMLGQFGTMKSYHFLTALETPAVKNLIWKITFERKGKDGKQITQQVLFRLVTGFDENKSVILSFGFL